MSIASKIKTIIKKQFVAGLLVMVPLIATYFVLRFLFVALDGILDPLVEHWLGRRIPGLGAAATIVLILLAGLITTNYLGARLLHAGDRLVAKMPLIRVVYGASRQFIESMTAPSSKAFSEVVLVEYPRTGIYAIGFLSGSTTVVGGGGSERLRMVFIPSTPTPFTGWVVLVPEKDVRPIKLTVEEAAKILVSGGLVTPEVITRKAGPQNGEIADAAG
jgi:uncharacterized membrane protein